MSQNLQDIIYDADGDGEFNHYNAWQLLGIASQLCKCKKGIVCKSCWAQMLIDHYKEQ